MKNITKTEVLAEQMLQALINISDALYGISEGLDFIASEFNRVGLKPTLSKLKNEDAINALKAGWLNANPQHTEEEYQAAIQEFEKIFGL